MTLLCWSELEYGQFQLHAGEEFIIKYLLGQDKYGYGEMTSSKIFWRWWVNQWNFRDEGFAQYAASLPQYQRVVQYKSLHSPYNVRVRPHKIILERINDELITNKRQ